MTTKYEFITTKVRPIKKLFVLDPDDIQGFIDTVRLVSGEIGGLYNIILLNDDRLRSPNSLAFVERHDPDVVMNLSRCDDASLYDTFRRRVANRSDGKTKLNAYSTPLLMLSNQPTIERYAPKEEECQAVVANAQATASPEHLFAMVHCGLCDAKDATEMLRMTRFAKREIRYVSSPEDVFSVVDKPERNFLYLSAPQLGSHSYSGNIWQVSYNRQGLFLNESYHSVVMSAATDLQGIVYYWNTRATYPFCSLMWLPVELADRYGVRLDGFTHYAAFGDEAKKQGQLLVRSGAAIDSSRFYFPVLEDDWRFFENKDHVPVQEGKLVVTHPCAKLFSREGFNLKFMLDVRGLEDFLFPPGVRGGELFVEVPDRQFSPYHFARIGRRGLSVYSTAFKWLEDSDLTQAVALPSFPQLLDAHFGDFGVQLRRTEKTALAERCLSLVRRQSDTTYIGDRAVFEMLVSLTPKRLSRLKRELADMLRDGDGTGIGEVLEKRLGGLQTYTGEKITTADELVNMLDGTRSKAERLQRIHELYEAGVLLRGKSFPCESCRMRLWYSFASLANELTCYCCNARFSVPVADGNGALPDSYRLNELMIRAVDQGLLPVLLTHQFFARQRFWGKRSMFCVGVVNNGTNQALTDLDIVLKLGNRIGLAEVKTNDRFDPTQTAKLIQVAKQVRANFLAFASLHGKDSDEVGALAAMLREEGLEMPAFILTEEVLFAETPMNLAGFFETINDLECCLSGPLIVADGVAECTKRFRARLEDARPTVP